MTEPSDDRKPACDDIVCQKQAIRSEALEARGRQPNQPALSRVILGRLVALPEYAAAGTVMGYVDVRAEVRTAPWIVESLAGGKRIVVPYCQGKHLGLFDLKGLDELAVGAFGIREPKPELRARSERRVEVEELDLILVPGVAFDRQGGRLGHGRAYYDGLLTRARSNTLIVGCGYECQLPWRIPMEPHDVFMDRVVTEEAIYRGKGRSTKRPANSEGESGSGFWRADSARG